MSSDAIGTLRGLFGELLGIPAEQVPVDVSFVELGADSLLLVEATEVIEDRLGVDVPFRDLLETCPDITSLAGYVAGRGGRAMAPAPSPEAPVPSPAGPVPEPPPATPPALDGPLRRDAPGALLGGSADDGAGPALEREVIGLQLEVMRQQLDLLRTRGGGTGPSPAPRPPARTADAAGPALQAPPQALGPYRPIEAGRGPALNAVQAQHVKALVTALEARTPESKRLVARQRNHADSRMSAGFHALWKEIVHPIVAERAEGSRFVDVDGNSYVDISMDFGVNHFGHNPAFIREAIAGRLADGMPLAPYNTLVGPVSALMAELTGLPRTAFQNSGTEAVMVAVRAARTVTRKPKIVIFSGSYHGTFDGVLVRGSNDPSRPPGTAVPLTRGMPPSMAQDVLIAGFADPAALDLIASHADEIAAVLVEPVQSRMPHIQPLAWLRELRELTARLHIALIFDEVITGFRLHPGGMQALGGVRADLAVYGKVIGGGIPIGAVSGTEEYLAPIDGGLWEYGDDSWPGAETMVFAGTFSKHPLAMAAAHAVLLRLKEAGPGLWDDLDARTARLQTRVNEFLERDGIPLRVERAGSLFRFFFGRGFGYPDLFFHHLLNRGVYVWEGRNCYLSTAHTDQDVDLVVEAVRATVEDMAADGFVRGGGE
ncbi:aminotransferase class III-fold pyridoxal phosphate-dependent enzyme [Streptomyces orinoci]|uniref:Aminotransferase class III-fold pyridoxal phosphate-dependent enzyme n=1 Tax=Streptomyces orinoci TaxID=67339 RepID=A0ABV3JRI0_STRON|nr:aminotransferase class III-fold pyridoxal phosphate-dependent enzyme [Streptomyces orinoci]